MIVVVLQSVLKKLGSIIVAIFNIADTQCVAQPSESAWGESGGRITFVVPSLVRNVNQHAFLFKNAENGKV